MDKIQEQFISQQLKCEPMNPISFFQVQSGEINFDKSNKECTIILDLKSFEWCAEVVNTKIIIEQIKLEVVDISDLFSRTFTFSHNEDIDYPEGSVYLEGKHNNIILNQIKFGIKYSDICDDNIDVDYITTTLLYQFCWEGDRTDEYPEIARVNQVLKVTYTDN